jgi:transposase
MPKLPQLTDLEKGQILALADQNLSQTEISNKIGRSQSTVSKFLKDPQNYGKRKRSGRPRTLSLRTERQILRNVSNHNWSARTAKDKLNIPLTVRRVRQIISSSPNLKYEKRKSTPKLKKGHIENRLKWASEKIIWDRKWREVIFSDEKKFNLDGPDGNQFYWHDIRKEPEYYSKQAMGGGSVMVWGGFGYSGKTPLVVINGKQNSQNYIRQLELNLVPFGEEIGGEEWLFQQDNAAIHTAGIVKSWFEANHIRVIDWPAKSPDLNPIENLWGIMVRTVYRNGKQYENVSELKSAIKVCWEEIDDSVLKKLADSMTHRLIEVLKKKGGFIGY